MTGINSPTPVSRLPQAIRQLRVVALVCLSMWGGGCAGFTNPVAKGIEVRRLPAEILGRPRTELHPLPQNLFRQHEPEEYRLDKGDVLAIVADEVLGPIGLGGGPGGAGGRLPAPVQVNPSPGAQRPAYQGYPIPVLENGTITLPNLPPINVKGMTTPEVQRLLIRMITGDPTLPGSKGIVQPGQERVLVDLIQPRRYRVIVVREDSSTPQSQGGVGFVQGINRKAAGFSISLDAYQNDLLHALNATGGPPGVDAKNEVVIRRGQYDNNDPRKGWVKIPLRARPDEPITFTEKDIILNEGDTVYIEARDTEVYYTAGLMGATQVALPRDYDLRVIEAIAQVRGPLLNGSFSQTAFVASSVNSGIGNPSPSLVTVIRRIPNTQQEVLIRVDLNLCFRDQRENILIRPGDIIVLQERPSESLVRYLSSQFHNNLNYLGFNNSHGSDTITATNP